MFPLPPFYFAVGVTQCRRRKAELFVTPGEMKRRPGVQSHFYNGATGFRTITPTIGRGSKFQVPSSRFSPRYLATLIPGYSPTRNDGNADFRPVFQVPGSNVLGLTSNTKLQTRPAPFRPVAQSPSRNVLSSPSPRVTASPRQVLPSPLPQ